MFQTHLRGCFARATGQFGALFVEPHVGGFHACFLLNFLFDIFRRVGTFDDDGDLSAIRHFHSHAHTRRM